MLLLLDNFERLLQAVPVVAELSAACQGLTVLATSRASLRLRGERQFQLSPLSLAEEASPAYSPAVQLFDERARAVSSGFELGTRNQATVAEICERLDGLPLAVLAQVRRLHPGGCPARAGDIERARTLLEESLASLRRRTYPLRVANALAIMLSRLGGIECELGRGAGAGTAR